MKGRNGPHQEGAALFVAVLVLALMGALGIMAFNTVLVDRQVAGFQNRAKTSFYAAEAAAAEGRSLVRGVGSRARGASASEARRAPLASRRRQWPR